jgi:formamidase
VTHTLTVSRGRPLAETPGEGHNRWHPEVPPVLTIGSNDVVSVEVRDGFDGQITPQSTAADVLELDLYRGHPLTGPMEVEDAAPGDLLDIEILTVTPDSFGYTAVLPGVGPLGGRVREPFLALWSLGPGGVARSPELPGIAIRGAPFLGVIGVAPSHDSLLRIALRERALADAGHALPLPTPKGAVPAGVVAQEGLPTVPPREQGGNVDIRQLTAGSRLTLPVEVPGALLSFGDPHFAQGDGESGGTAIEMSASAIARVILRKPAPGEWRPRSPMFEFNAAEAARSAGPHIATTGVPVTADGESRYLDVYTAAQVALNELVDYLMNERALGEGQALVLTSVAADLRISEIVNVPNVLVSAVLPLDVFEDR